MLCEGLVASSSSELAMVRFRSSFSLCLGMTNRIGLGSHTSQHNPQPPQSSELVSPAQENWLCLDLSE